MPIKDREKRNEYLRDWYKKNPERCKQYSYDYYERQPAKKLLKAAKGNSKARGLEFNLSEEDIVIPTHCPYLGIELTSKVESCNHPSTLSLDRIDSSKGYIPGNVQVISRLANLMKSYATEDQLITFAKNVLKIHEIT